MATQVAPGALQAAGPAVKLGQIPAANVSMAHDSGRGSLPTVRLIIALLVFLVGLGLFFWLAPRTPVVAVPPVTHEGR